MEARNLDPNLPPEANDLIGIWKASGKLIGRESQTGLKINYTKVHYFLDYCIIQFTIVQVFFIVEVIFD
jgi:hypothetical protein